MARVLLVVGPMNHRIATLLPLFFTACVDSTTDDIQDPPTPPDPQAQCVPADTRATKTVTVSGTIVDFATGAPVADAHVDITTAWDVAGMFPRGVCPLLASVTTGADGKFGPITVQAGSLRQPSIMAFLVHGGGRAQTVDDLTACAESTCTIDHTIAVPSVDLARAWRKELDAGGMTDAFTRGLVAFDYKEHDGTGAADVIAQTLVVDPNGKTQFPALQPGKQVRYLEADRATLAPAAQTTTTASGIALIGIDAPAGAIEVTGARSDDSWFGVGCLVEEGWIFVEDRTRS